LFVAGYRRRYGRLPPKNGRHGRMEDTDEMEGAVALATTAPVFESKMLFRENFFQEIQSPRILALAQPKDGLLADYGVLIGFNYAD